MYACASHRHASSFLTVLDRHDPDPAPLPRRHRRLPPQHHRRRRARARHPARGEQAAQAAGGRTRPAAVLPQGQEPGRDHRCRRAGDRACAGDPGRGAEHPLHRRKPAQRGAWRAAHRHHPHPGPLRPARLHRRAEPALPAGQRAPAALRRRRGAGLAGRRPRGPGRGQHLRRRASRRHRPARLPLEPGGAGAEEPSAGDPGPRTHP